MAGLLAAFLVVVVLYCLGRAVLPALRASDHARDLDAWQVALGLGMVGMLLAPASGQLSTLILVVSAAGLGWALVRGLRRDRRTAYLPLAVGSGAMVAMVLLPQPATAAATHAGHGGGGASPLVPLLLVLLMAVLAARMLDAARRTAPLATRLDAGCDVAMTVSMAYLLLLMV
jgi:hypothetical protein